MSSRSAGWLGLCTVLVSASPAVAQDAKIIRTWKAKCASCHGEDGRAQTTQGLKMGVRDIGRPDAQKLSDAELREVIVKGLKRTVDGKTQEMDGYASLSAEQLDGLVSYTRSFRRAAAPKAPPPPAPPAPAPSPAPSPPPAPPPPVAPAPSPAAASPAAASPVAPSPASATAKSPAIALVDLNTASKTDLKKRLKLTSTQITKLIKNRPFSTVDELVTKKVVTKTVLKKLRKLIEVRGPE